MSKAEEKAMEKYPPRSILIVPARGGGYYADKHLRDGYIEGYRQAEEELIDKTLAFLKDRLYKDGYVGIIDLCDDYIKAMKYE